MTNQNTEQNCFRQSVDTFCIYVTMFFLNIKLSAENNYLCGHCKLPQQKHLFINVHLIKYI